MRQIDDHYLQTKCCYYVGVSTHKRGRKLMDQELTTNVHTRVYSKFLQPMWRREEGECVAGKTFTHYLLQDGYGADLVDRRDET